MIKFKKSYFFWTIFFLLTLILHSNHALDSDEGVILEGAWNIINGRQIYSDFFALVTPASYYLLAGLWQLVGISYWSANTLAILALFFSAVGIYRISRLVGGRGFYWPAIFFILSSWIWPLISYYIFSLLTLVWALYYFCRALESGSRRQILWSGLLSSLTFWFLQTKGLALIFSLASYLFFLFLFKKQNIYIRQLAYYLVFSLVPLAGLFIFGSMPILYQYLFIFPVFNYHGVINNSLYLWGSFMLLWLASVIFLVRRNQSEKIFLLLYLQLILLLLALSLPDWFHIFLALVPFYVLWPLAMEKILAFRRLFKWLGLGALFVLAGLLAWPSLERAWPKSFRLLAGHQLLAQIARNCQQGQYLYAGAFIPGVYFESRKLNATPYSWLITNHHTEEQFQSARDALAAKPPECAVLSPLFVGKYGYNHDNAVDNYIRQHYKVIWSDENFRLFKLNSEL